MKWFGESWGAPVCEPDQQVGTPWGFPCDWCRVAITQDDRGFVLSIGRAWLPYHRGCLWSQLGIDPRALGDVED